MGYSLLALIGTLTTLTIALRFTLFIYTYRRPSSLSRYRHDGNSWALITGSSDGIGYGLAQELAKEGFNIVLHGRNANKLAHRKEELQNESAEVQVKWVVADATAGSNASVEEIVKQVADLNLTVLVNNIGGVEVVMLPAHRSLSAISTTETDALINLNARFATQLTRALLPKLRSNSPSLLLNVGSMVDRGMPFQATYSASKAYLMAFSKSLRLEFRADGTEIEVLGVLTAMATDVTHRKVKESLFVPRARKVARSALARVGCGQAVVVAYWAHALQGIFVDWLPDIVYEKLIIGIVREAQKEGLKRQ